jgi:hypothetical protein
MDIDGKHVLIAGLGLGGMLWMRSKVSEERDLRVAAERSISLQTERAGRKDNGAAAPPRANGTSSTREARPASRQFDNVFAAHGQGLPVPYLRALALRESGMNPTDAKGNGWGLISVVEVVRRDFNERQHTTYSRQDLRDPAISVTIAATALATIIASYARNHPRIVNMQADWSNPRFVELLTFGWNAGWSERAGVGRVARYLEQRGITDITIDNVHQAARAAGASEHLSNPAKVKWCKSVVRQYAVEVASELPEIQMEGDYGRPELEPLPPTPGPITSPSQLDPPTVAGVPIDPYPNPKPNPYTPAVGEDCACPNPTGERHA